MSVVSKTLENLIQNQQWEQTPYEEDGAITDMDLGVKYTLFHQSSTTEIQQWEKGSLAPGKIQLVVLMSEDGVKLKLWTTPSITKKIESLGKTQPGRTLELVRTGTLSVKVTVAKSQPQKDPICKNHKKDLWSPLIPLLPSKFQHTWKKLCYLSNLPEYTILTGVSSKYYLPLFQGKRLVIVANGKHYVAGPSLEKQEYLLTEGCLIRLGKRRVGQDRVYFRTCVIFGKEEWWHFRDMESLEPEFINSPNVLETRVLQSGDKCSVLALQDSGIITKLHPKCKLYGRSKSHAKKTGNPSMVVMAFGSNLP